MDRTIEMARTKRSGDIEQSSVTGGLKNKRPALGTLTNANGQVGEIAAAGEKRRVTRSQSKTVGGPEAGGADASATEAEEADGEDRGVEDVGREAEVGSKAVEAAVTSAPASISGSMEIDAALHAVAPVPGGAVDAVAAVVTAAHVNIDAGSTDPNVVVDYVDEIYQYLRGLENKFRPKPGYMKKQRDINHGMRTILVDWLVEVAEEYKLNSHTLYIAVGYIDRFLSEMSVNRGKLQLVGVTSMLLASKYEEIYPPAVDEFVYITDNTYTRDQILKMENLVLKVLQFDMGAVTAYSFAERFLKAAGSDDRTRHLTQYLMELTLQDGERYLKYRPSVVAAAAVCVTLDTLQMPCWTATLQHYTELKTEDITACVEDVFLTFCSADKVQQQAVREKYGEDKFMHVSRLAPGQRPPDLGSTTA